MNAEKALMKFVTTVIKHNPDDNGQKYNEDQVNLVETLGYSIVEKIHPTTFEKNIVENKMKLKSKRRKTCIVKIPLNPVQIIHFKLLYNIIYIDRFYPSKIAKFKLSEDASELIDNEEKIFEIYKKIKKISLN